MKNFMRFLLVIVVVGFVFVIGQRVAASPPPPIDVTGEPGTGSGPFQIGGCVTGTVSNFQPGIKLNVALLDGWNSYPTNGLPALPDYYWTLPGGPADIFSCVVNVKFFENDQLIHTLAQDRGTAQVCMATPANKTGSIYILDKFFNDKPVWSLVGGPFDANSIGCVPADKSGVYAFYAPDPTGHPTVSGDTITTVTYVEEGSVLVPEYTTTVVQSGPLVLGGCVTGNVKDLPQDGKLEAALITVWGDLPALPQGVGEFYRCIAELKFYQGTELVKQLPVEKGYATICFAVPPNSNGTIFFLNKFFDQNATWTSVAGPFPSGISCGPADQTGLYGMVDKK